VVCALRLHKENKTRCNEEDAAATQRRRRQCKKQQQWQQQQQQRGKRRMQFDAYTHAPTHTYLCVPEAFARV